MTTIKNRSLSNIKNDRNYVNCTFKVNEKKAYTVANSNFHDCQFSSSIIFDFLDVCQFDNCHFDEDCKLYLRIQEFPQKFSGLPSLKSLSIKGFPRPFLFLPMCSRHESRSIQKNDFFHDIGLSTHLTHLNILCYEDIGKLPEIHLNIHELCLDSVNGELYADIVKLPLKRLIVDGGTITNVYKIIGKLRSLEYLILRQMTIMEHPEQIGKLTCLKHLEIMHCLYDIPKEIGNLTSLVHLKIFTRRRRGNNSILLASVNQVVYGATQNLPREIAQLTQLKTCYLQVNFTDVPQEFMRLTSLQQLTLFSDRCTDFPSVVCQLRSLTHLSLCMPISELPEEIGQLSSLTHLSITSCNIRSLPRSIAKLKSLTHLYLDQNPALQIGEEIQQLTSLQRLSLRNCRISAQQKRQIKSWQPNCIIDYSKIGAAR